MHWLASAGNCAVAAQALELEVAKATTDWRSHGERSRFRPTLLPLARSETRAPGPVAAWRSIPFACRPQLRGVSSPRRSRLHRSGRLLELVPAAPSHGRKQWQQRPLQLDRTRGVALPASGVQYDCEMQRCQLTGVTEAAVDQ